MQEDRKDKSAVGWDHKEAPQKHASQVDHKVKPVIEGVKPSNLRAKFENLAKNSEEESRKRAEEQKRLREAKDKRDREEAAKQTVVENTPKTSTETPPPKGSRAAIQTGRAGGIGNAISAFNQMQSPVSETPPARKEPIVIPKAQPTKVEVPKEEPAEVPVKAPTPAFVAAAAPAPAPEAKAPSPTPTPVPDVVPQIEVETVPTPPRSEPESPEQEPTPQTQVQPVAQAPAPAEAPAQPVAIEEPLYQNQAEIKAASPVPPTNGSATEETASAPEEAIYANSDNLADYLEDTGIHAIALYDYQAADDDEISFDPDDVVTHIDKIDDGWWRGLCKNRYGLFPANYVQVVEQNS